MIFADKSRNLNGASSFFLDTMRIIAALTVFFGHAYDLWTYDLEGHSYSFSNNLEHSSVIIFFVLSGYVIAHTTTKNKRSRAEYAVARLSRLYSIVFPAVILTAIIQVTIYFLNPQLNSLLSRGPSWPRYIISLSFLNEIWFFSAAPPMNTPLWSLSYEFWYYVIFGCLFYVNKENKKSYFLLIVACIIAGPKILIMMPIWLAGNYAYRLKRPKISDDLSWLLVFMSLIIAGLFILFLPHLPHIIGTPPLYWASQFLSDWTIGIFICLAFWLIPSKQVYERVKESRMVRMYRQFADLTFPLYVFHMPLFLLWEATIGIEKHNFQQLFLVSFLILFFVIALGSVLEKYKYIWSIFFTKAIQRFNFLRQRISRQLNFSS